MTPDQLSATFAALADPTRRAILARLIARGREAQWRSCRLEARPMAGAPRLHDHSLWQVKSMAEAGKTFDHFSRRNSVMAASGRVVWGGRVISVLASLMFVMSSFMKFKGGAQVTQGMSHLGLPESLIMPLAILEISCVVIYLIPATSILGAILLTGYMGGAVCTHMRVGDPFYIQIALGVFVWLGIYLREPRLKEIIPLRRL